MNYIRCYIIWFFLSNVEQINTEESYKTFYLIHFKTTKTTKNFILKNKNKNNCDNIDYSKKKCDLNCMSSCQEIRI